ncbi:MAG: ATP:cob(I)alamin adenosyltransferase, partial [Chloroflexi bacterium]
RAERSVVACVDAGLVDADPLLPWLNRASDFLFVLARASERAPRPAKSATAKSRAKTRRAKR